MVESPWISRLTPSRRAAKGNVARKQRIDRAQPLCRSLLTALAADGVTCSARKMFPAWVINSSAQHFHTSVFLCVALVGADGKEIPAIEPWDEDCMHKGCSICRTSTDVRVSRELRFEENCLFSRRTMAQAWRVRLAVLTASSASTRCAASSSLVVTTTAWRASSRSRAPITSARWFFRQRLNTS